MDEPCIELANELKYIRKQPMAKNRKRNGDFSTTHEANIMDEKKKFTAMQPARI